MAKLLKNKNNNWIRANNDIAVSTFKESLNTTESLGITKHNQRTVVYYPVHNINDIYEWQRIFRDSYLYSDNYDKHGFAQHFYFDKSRGESIKGWFPNLIEVKCSSVNDMIYYQDGLLYVKNSVDFIDFSDITKYQNLPTLFIDGEQVFNNENILLKNQEKFELITYLIDPLSNNYTYYIDITANLEIANYFKIDDTLIIFDGTIYHENKLIKTTIETINLNTYLLLKSDKPIITNTISIGSKENGDYTYIDLRVENGVYIYKDSNIILHSNMLDKYKTYNQIVYTYQGLTNMNNQYYLRRDERKYLDDLITVNPNYSYYPVNDSINPLIYSKGEAFLIKYELEYNLNITNEDNFVNVDTACCSCLADVSIVWPEHPLTPPTYNYNDEVFRLLYLDNNVADKVFAIDKYGIGSYKATTDKFLPPTASNSIEFKLVDIDGKANILQDYLDTDWFGMTLVNPLTSFKFYNDINNGIKTYTNFTLSSNNLNITHIDPIGEIKEHDFLKIRLDFVINGETITIYDSLIIVDVVNVNNATNLDIDFQLPFDIDFLNDFNNKIDIATSYSITIELVNNFNDNFVNAINKCIVGQAYEFEYTTLNTEGAIFKNIRQTNKFKYSNYGCEIVTDLVNFEYIEHKIPLNIRKYFYGYTSEDYLTTYLSLVGNIEFTQLQDVPVIAEDDDSLDSFFIIDPNYKGFQPIEFPNIGKSNIISFGVDYKELILDNIKPHTYIEIENITQGVIDSDLFVYSVTWNDQTQKGEIVLLNYAEITSSGDNINLKPYKDLTSISNNLKAIFDKEFNNIRLGDDLAYLTDTSSYAYSMMNYATLGLDKNAYILNNITGLIYKEYNEPRISLFKRDRYFKFDEDPIVNCADISIANVLGYDSLSDSYLGLNTINVIILNTNDLVIIKDQTNLFENGIFRFNGTDLVREFTTFNTYYEYAGDFYKIYYELPVVFGTSNIRFFKKEYRVKKDNRLLLNPLEICKLGVDNKTQSCRRVSRNYDFLELSEDVVAVGTNLNAEGKIRFIDGLSEYKILNNIDGQGRFAWILQDSVITLNAIVGCEFGNGNGRLVWYTGEWLEGTWCDGIWYNGIWHTGIWVNGERYSYIVNDYFYYVDVIPVINNNLSVWNTGTWFHGINHSGTMTDVVWHNGVMNGGVIVDGIWYNGAMNGGVLQHILWYYGRMTGGDFETGIWYDGIVDGEKLYTLDFTTMTIIDDLVNINPTQQPRFGSGSTGHISGNIPIGLDIRDKAIWKKGTFNDGIITTGNNKHNGTIFYAGVISKSTILGGTLVSCVVKDNSVFEDGVWLGGYKITTLVDHPNTITNKIKILTIDPAQYDTLMGLSDCPSYVGNENTEHNQLLHIGDYYLTGIPTGGNSTFNRKAFINFGYFFNYALSSFTNPNADYTLPTFDINTNSTQVTNTIIELIIAKESANTSTYQIENPLTDTIDGTPQLCSVFKDGSIFKGGIWLNGVLRNASFEQGVWINGFAYDNAIFGKV